MRLVPVTLCAAALTLGACGGSGGTGPSGQTPTLTVTLPASQIVSGSSAQATATYRNSSGQSSPAANVSWTSTDPVVASVNGSTGMVTGARVGATSIRATSSGLTAQFNITVTTGPAASVALYAGDGQIGSPGAVLPDALCVIISDMAGNPVAGRVATLTVATGGGTMGSPAAPTSGANGVAIGGQWTLGSALGEQTVTATVAGVGSVTFKGTAR